ncbi:Asparaginyl-tRNA synthetase, cytoplasmic (Asparagine--tRNA ligase) (AsnRS) [Balamuthia mandrillaris]
MQQTGGDKKAKVLLVVDYTTNWYAKFAKATLRDGTPIRVEQTEWKDMNVEASSEEGAVVHLKASENPLPFSTQKEERTVRPDFMLVRNFPGDLHDSSFKNMVVGLLFGNVPAVNTIESIYRCMDRPVVYAEMLKIQRKLRKEGLDFPIIPMNYYPNLRASTQQLLSPSFPAVIKVSSTHAGYGKIQAKDAKEMQDVQCVLALHSDYYTAEPFVPHEYEYRIQKIGNHYRGFRRNSDSHWKNNWGALQFEDHPLTELDKRWADEAGLLFGGLDILALDVLHKEDGTNVILELNDTANGLCSSSSVFFSFFLNFLLLVLKQRFNV